MIRFAIFSTIVLALGTGESLPLLCRAICDRAALADVGACHHSPSITPLTVTDDQTCGDAGAPVIAELRNPAHQTTAQGLRTSSEIVESHEVPTVTTGHALFVEGPLLLSF